MPPITLITDFGTRDYYVGAMKGVILGIAPNVPVVDVTHEIEPQNIIQASFVLRQTLAWFPPGTVHLVVVDPGVGSQRAVLAGQYAGQIVIAPDNGIITLAHRELMLEALHVVENTELFCHPVSNTFHGRDILAPVAAHVAGGVPLPQLGPVAGGVEVLKLPEVEQLEPRGLRGTVLFADHFGNLISNIPREEVTELIRQHPDVAIYVGGRQVGPLRKTYSEVATGEPLALIGSCSTLEISVNRGRADDLFGSGPNIAIELR